MKKSYIFNPESDMALANGDANYLPPRSARRMAIDLAFLPVWYADNEDTVLIPGSDLLYYWSKTSTSRIVRTDIKWITEKEPIPNQPCSPWGWNPSLVKYLKQRGLSEEFLPSTEDMGTLRQLSGRHTAVEILRLTMQELASVHPLVGTSALCLTEESIAHEVGQWAETMLKAPWSSSGKGLRRGQRQYVSPLSGWCARTLAQQGAVVVEPLYNKVKDFAMEFYSSGDGSPLIFVGYSSFVTDANGAYEGNRMMTDEAIEEDLTAFVPRDTLHQVCTCLQRLIGERVSTLYRGYIGVDMMICRTSTNRQEEDNCLAPESDKREEEYRLHPCVEINLRMNMGVVAHILYERYVAPGYTGRFMVEYYPTPDALREAHQRRTEEYPLQLSHEGRICQGYQPLTPVGKETQYIAWIIID